MAVVALDTNRNKDEYKKQNTEEGEGEEEEGQAAHGGSFQCSVFSVQFTVNVVWY